MVESLMFGEGKATTQSGEDAFRRVAARKLRERGCQEAEIGSSLERLLAKEVGLALEDKEKS